MTLLHLNEKKRPGPRLSRAAQQLIRERIIAGDSNTQIREALQAAGHPHDLSRQAINAYRQDPELKAEIERASVEGFQLAFAQRNGRIQFVNERLIECALRLSASSRRRVSNAALVTIGAEARAWLAEMGRLVDGVTTVRAGRANPDGTFTEVEESQPGGFTLGMFADYLEKAIRDVYGDDAVDAAGEGTDRTAPAAGDAGEDPATGGSSGGAH